MKHIESGFTIFRHKTLFEDASTNQEGVMCSNLCEDATLIFRALGLSREMETVMKR